MRYHMGCGGERLAGYVNVDIRDTPATDLVADLNSPELPSDQPVDCVFSHAFFEHLKRDYRVPHLRRVRQSLAPDGFVCYLGLPDFRRIAELYLQRGPGIIGPTFDLFNVYRLTHGDPDAKGDEGYLPQLHKSLFDSEEVGRLVRDAGFSSYVTLRYSYPGELDVHDLSLGFFATAAQRSTTELQEAAVEFLREWDGRFVRLETVRFEDGRSRNPQVARIASVPQRRFVQRVAYGIADRLARHTRPA